MEDLNMFHHPSFGDLPVYQGWGNVPDNFVTETGLKQRGKRRTPRQRPVAVVYTQSRRRQRYYLLYNVVEAMEKRALTARQKAALQRVKARNSCRRCGVSFVKLSPEGNCSACQPYLDRRRQAKTKAIQWAQAVISQPFLVLDTETTGLGSWDRIVEIAVIDETGGVLLNTLVNPEMYIPAAVISIHGITDEMVRNKPTFQDILPELEAILSGKPIVIYNVAFDKRFLAHGGIEVEDYEFQCAMLMYAKFFGAWSDYYKNWKRQSLQKACHYCGIQQKRIHRAASDCEVTRQIIDYMAKATVRQPGQMKN